MPGDTISASELASMARKSDRFIRQQACKQAWPYRNGGNRARRYLISGLPTDYQTLVAKKMDIPDTLLPALCPEAALAVARKNSQELPSIYKGMAGKISTWTDETALDADILRDPRVIKWSRIVQEALNVPSGWKKRAWIEAVAVKHDTSFQTVYRYIKKYEKRGLAGLRHTKSNKNQPKSWTPEAVDWWVGLCLKREHRKVAKDELYGILSIEAHRRGWRIGGYESALWWFRQKATPQLLALQRGGVRALDNLLPPVLRDYSDLAPFEILVGDQHRFDFWVVDETTGEVFRPEGYFWQDLRTRCFYGGALDKKYDGYLIGLALRMGLHIFGAFGSIYTDNGKPELSKYVMGILKDMGSLGLKATPIVDAAMDLDDDPELVNPLARVPGSHIKAIVRNAKAKMIEGTFNVLEGILRDMRVPGYVKELGGLQEENEVDEKELQRLARTGKLPTFWEFVGRVFQGMDYYNSEKVHRGVIREWAWKPKPKTATPMDCLRACYNDGWRPGPISNQAIDLVFLPRDTRTVDRGRITFRNDVYEHEALVSIPRGYRVEIRFDPLDPEYLLVFDNDRFVCRAEPVEYSSMKNLTLASRKIEEKRRIRKGFILEYRKLTSAVPDFLEYSTVSLTERAAAEVGREKEKARKKRLAEQEASRVRTAEELEAEVRELEAKAARPARKKPVPKRPAYFLKDLDRYKWIVACELAGGELIEEDIEFKAAYEARMNEDERERWDVVRELGVL